jgi:hypothetical protein
MGASDFHDQVRKREGLTMAQAFDEAHHNAKYDYGHAGYTGTIAEKPGYVTITLPDGWTSTKLWNALHEVEELGWRLAGDPEKEIPPFLLAQELIKAVGRTTAESWAQTMSDKWGPAIGFETTEHFEFFGYASS